MTDLNVKTSTGWKQRLKASVKSVLQRIELLKKKEGWQKIIPLGNAHPPRRMLRPRRGRAGLTLLEATLWTLVAIVVLSSVFGLYNGVTDSLRTAALRSQLTRAVAIIERDHSRSGTYKGTSLLGFLNDEGFSEKELSRTGNGASAAYEFKTPYDTAITIVPDSNPRKFVVTVSGLPPSACEAAVSAFAERGSGLDSAKIGGEAARPQSGLTEKAVSDDCDTDTGVAIVVLTF